MTRKVLLVATVAGVLLALVAACSAGSGHESMARSSKSLAPDTTRVGDATEAAKAAPAADGVGATEPTAVPPATGRQVVTNATLGMRVKRVDAVVDDATSTVTAAGGYLFSERVAAGVARDATLVFKVPPTAFATVLERLAGLGTKVTRDITTDDVTAQVVDLEGRLASATSSTARLRTLFDQATNVADVVAIEGELVKREGEVESLQGQLRVVQAQVAMATVTVHVVRAVAPAPAPEEEATGFLAGLATGWDAFAAAVATGATALGVALPFLVLAALAASGGLALRRRLRPPAATPAP